MLGLPIARARLASKVATTAMPERRYQRHEELFPEQSTTSSHLQTVNFLAARHEQHFAVLAAERAVRAELRDRDQAERLTLRRRHPDAAAAGKVEIAVFVDAHAVGRVLVIGVRVEEHLAGADRAVFFDWIRLPQELMTVADVEHLTVERGFDAVGDRH